LPELTPVGRYFRFSRGNSNVAVRAQAALAGQGVSIVPYTVTCQDILNGALTMIARRSAPSQHVL
jgi:LysR family glycine cleavage system transcriptional activator